MMSNVEFFQVDLIPNILDPLYWRCCRDISGKTAGCGLSWNCPASTGSQTSARPVFQKLQMQSTCFFFCWRNIKMCLLSLLWRATPHYSGKIWGCFCVDLWAVLVLHLPVFTAFLCVAGFQEHLDLCRRGRGRWGGLICGHVPNLTPAANCLSLTVPRDPPQKLMVTLAATLSSFILSAFDHMCLELLKSWARAGPVHSRLAAQHGQQLSHP